MMEDTADQNDYDGKLATFRPSLSDGNYRNLIMQLQLISAFFDKKNTTKQRGL